MRASVTTRSLAPADRPPLEKVLRETGAFTEEEVRVALELIDCGLEGTDADYRFVVAEREGVAVGYACYGPTPLTEGTYDLYWIAVSPALHGKGVGRKILEAVEEACRRENGRMLLIETASKPSYEPTRAFYQRTGYHEIARIPDFYKEGDDKVTYRKLLVPAPAPIPAPPKVG